jgi:hypothetical protein
MMLSLPAAILGFSEGWMLSSSVNQVVRKERSWLANTFGYTMVLLSVHF